MGVSLTAGVFWAEGVLGGAGEGAAVTVVGPAEFFGPQPQNPINSSSAADIAGWRLLIIVYYSSLRTEIAGKKPLQQSCPAR